MNVIDAPCPGLDYATVDAAGNAYFSAWVYAAGGAAVLDQPTTCVFELPAQGEPRVAFDFPSKAEGRQGGVMRSVGNGRALLSVLHDERFPASDAPISPSPTTGASGHTISHPAPRHPSKRSTGTPAPNSFDIDEKTYRLVAAADYSATTVYDLGDGQSLTPAFDTRGWATRRFRVR